MKTSELTGAALDWAVNHAERLTGILAPVNYCGKWEHGGPIIEREGITLRCGLHGWDAELPEFGVLTDGKSALEAAMRCLIASKLGDEIELPKELL